MVADVRRQLAGISSQLETEGLVQWNCSAMHQLTLRLCGWYLAAKTVRGQVRAILNAHAMYYNDYWQECTYSSVASDDIRFPLPATKLYQCLDDLQRRRSNLRRISPLRSHQCHNEIGVLTSRTADAKT